MEGEKQGTLEPTGGEDSVERLKEALKIQNMELRAGDEQIKTLKGQLQMNNMQIQKIIKEDQDSIEIGAQATGRVKVYGNFGKKPEFARKISDALELLKASREKLEKVNGDSSGEKGGP